MADFKGEKLEANLATKKVFHYHDTVNKIKQLSSEVFKKTDQIIHYPRGFEGGEKYNTIRRFTYKGFKGTLPIAVVKLYSSRSYAHSKVECFVDLLLLSSNFVGMWENRQRCPM